MKKATIILLGFILMLASPFSLAACGGGSNGGGSGSSANPPANSGSPGTTQGAGGGGATSDLTTVSGYLAAYGLTEDDLKCANMTRIDKSAYIIDDGPSYGEITEVGVYISKKLTDDEARAWLEQVINKLNSLSDDGKIVSLFADDNGGALTADSIMSRSMFVGSGTYAYKGKSVGVTISVMPGYLDDEDPNDAMAACTLKLDAH